LPHSVVYKYDQYGNLIIESKCSDENFTGLNFCNVYKLKGNFISTGKIQIKYFEKQSKKYDLNFNYKTNTIDYIKYEGTAIYSFIDRDNPATLEAMVTFKKFDEKKFNQSFNELKTFIYDNTIIRSSN
jgi:hypothetical protein